MTVAKRSARIHEEREKKSELNCKCRLFSIFESHHGCSSRKLLLNGRPVNKHIMNEYPRKPDILAGFDEEVGKIKDRANLASLTVDASVESSRNSIRGDTSAKKHKKKQIIDEKQQLGGTDSDVFDHSAKNQKISSKISKSACKSTVHHPKNAVKQTYQHILGSAETFPNKLNVAAILEATYNQIHHEDNIYCGGAVDEMNVQLVQMSAKAFVDQMFLEKKFISTEGPSSESKPFSDALEILNSNKDLFVKRLKDPNSVLAKYIKNLQKFQMEKETTSSILDGNVSKLGSKDEGSFKKFECAAEIKKKNVNTLSWEKIKYQCEYPSKGSFTHRPSDKIVVLKPTPKNIKYPENVACHRSSLQSRHTSSRKGPDEKPKYLFFREMTRKLKYSFGGSGNTAYSSTNAKTKDELCKMQNLNSSYDTDTSCTNKMVLKKIDLSRVHFTEKQESDIIMEAKRHLSERLKNVTTTARLKRENFPKTLGRILSSPERDSWPPSPRDGECDSASAQMRFGPYSDLQMTTESSWKIERVRQRTRVSAWLQSAEVPSGVNFRRAGDSRIQNNEHEVNTDTDGPKYNVEVNGIPQPGNIYTLEVPNELNRTDVSSTTKRSNTTELQKEDCSATHLRLDSPSDNQIFTSALDDSPSSPSVYQLHVVNGSKDQEMHPSPVSVLDPFFTDDTPSPASIVVQSARKPLQPLCIDFEQYSHEESPIDPPVNPTASIDKQDTISNYVRSVLEASRLCCNDLSMIRAIPEQLLNASVFDEVEFLPTESRCDPKLIFDHMNEVLLEIYQRQISSYPWLSFIKPEIRSVLSEEQVFDEVTKEVKFHLLPQLGAKTLDLLTGSDMAKSRSWLDLRLGTEDIAIHISEDIMEGSIVDIILESNT
ncbi:unnamed protein product [Fraxinus pennsylvanica]|uniref:DUF4378 domain-containing protein n=1 Tax=Fraxinus pennsylvanica TaxID=56036 RepID=A0AAD2E2T2_9LAMI|nr:unnamed protein product [Fraxinus pennsylvanica]